MLAEARGYAPEQDLLCLLPRGRNPTSHTQPELDSHDLAHLGRLHPAVRLVVSARQTTAFTMCTWHALLIVGEA
ncbi:hypothetical protein [Virgisporangium aurantiacum]|uniref:Uncharacterized protein n=1 Tax=Virgisporangium aurantiacum TaxID=175570 RepID=A0A8J3Z1T4_9ACTN|nr:hypothetical protein [Virgisporangium aurantiacum]GIJ54723.1 hypothetical protein Vau01_022390 [Virgisporangium aurantiacum]